MTYLAADAAPPRTRGHVALSAKRRGAGSVLDGLHLSGSVKALFPRAHAPGPLQAVLLNTAGGLTGGDRIDITASAGPGSALTLTTQAAERAYRSASGTARQRTDLHVGPGACLHWLPQETILFDCCDLTRSLHVALAPDARLLLAEPLIFGRPAMGETLRHAALRDEISITRAGRPLYLDRRRLEGDLAATMTRPAIGAGAGAAVSLIYVAPDAEAHLAPLRALMPPTGGVSLLAPDLLALRLLAADGFALRRALLPALDRLTGNTLPKLWRL